ncbi:hypothetical protein SAMN04488527_1696 [Aliiroseovarius crassostreae]|uniref:Uncharacterized protein n=1 Tax=Aliiroseovarius crassostreae TaxID=154981 RepID=A0A0P7IY17_9RHOB|nr:hypothetical protein AKJ29_00900 [Aliiroseovarius crassostreae]SFU98431.1 hypothetical protein SAMN04488527_1696 [Aliiroseovarius crassostreae]
MNEVISLSFTNPLSAHPQRRYVVVERQDGNFSIAEQYYYQSSDEDGRIYAEGWASLRPQGIYADATSAESEARRLIEIIR